MALALLAFSTLNVQLATCFAQGTAFTYQGRMTDNGTKFTDARSTPAHGSTGETFVSAAFQLLFSWSPHSNSTANASPNRGQKG